MKLYIKEVKYDLWQSVPAYNMMSMDGTYDKVVNTTGWISEEEELYRYKFDGPFKVGKDQWIVREERYIQFTE